MTAVIVRFTVTSSAARWHGEARGVARPWPAVAAESSACGRGNAVGLTSLIPDVGQSFFSDECCSTSAAGQQTCGKVMLKRLKRL